MFYDQARVAALDAIEGGLIRRLYRLIIRFEQEGIRHGRPMQNEHMAFDEAPDTAGVDPQLNLANERLFQLLIVHRHLPPFALQLTSLA